MGVGVRPESLMKLTVSDLVFFIVFGGGIIALAVLTFCTI